MRRSALVNAVLFEEGRTRQEDMGVIRRLVEEEVVHDDAFHGGKTGRHMLRIRIRLQNVLALDVDAF